MKFYKIEEYDVIVGQNERENWTLLSTSKQKYKIFHLSSLPSCYVILQTENDVENSIIKECAELCLQNTKYKNLSGIKVDYTEISNTKKGEHVGEFFYKNKKKVNTIKL